MTFSAWVYAAVTGTDVILGMGGVETTWYISTDKAVFYTEWNGSAHKAWYTAAATVPHAKWVHLAVTYDATNKDNVPVHYINGSAVANDSETGTTPTGDWDGITNNSYLGSSGGGDRWQGQLADVAIWNRILSAEDIRAIHDTSFAGVVDNTADGWPLTIKRSSDSGITTVQWQAIASDPTRLK
jgi:hypothetical protein